jgi:hypothetical protein
MTTLVEPSCFCFVCYSLPTLWQVERALGRTYQRLKQAEQTQRAFSAASATIAQLGETIEEQALREQFLQRALGSLPRTVRGRASRRSGRALVGCPNANARWLQWQGKRMRNCAQ